MANVVDALTEIGNLKTMYTDEAIANMTKAEAQFKASLTKSSETIGGAGLEKPIIIKTNNNGQSTGTSPGPIRPAGVLTSIPSRVYLSRYNHPVTIDNILQYIAADKKETYMPSIVRYLELTLAAAAEYEERELFGTGSGIIASIPTGAASATQTMGITSYNILNMLIGSDVDIYSSAFVYKGTRNVSSVNYETGAVVFDSSITTANNDVITRAGVVPSTTPPSSMSPATGVMMEMTGIRAIIGNASDAATVQGISRAAYAQLQAQVLDKAGGSLVLNDIKRMDDRVSKIPGGKANGVTRYFARHELGRKLAEQFLPLQRYGNTPEGLKGGVDIETVPLFNKNLELFRLAPPGRFYGIDDSTIKYGQTKPLGWQTTRDGNQWVSQAVPGGSDTQSSVLTRAGNLITDNIGATSFVIKNVLEDSF